MKKISKIMIVVLMVALSIGSFFISPISAIVAAGATIGAAITIAKGVPTTGKYNEEIKIPVATSKDGEDVTIIVKNPKGTVIFNGTKNSQTETNPNGGIVKVSEDKKYILLTPNMTGDYKVQYVSKASADRFSVSSDIYTIKVSGVKPTISFASNSKNIVPAVVGENAKIVLPAPTVKVEGEEDSRELEIVEVSSEMASKLDAHTASNDEIKNLLKYSVSIEASSSEDVEFTYEVEKIAENKYAINYTVSPNKFGTYTVTYTYAEQGIMQATKKLQFECDRDFKLSYKDEKDLTLTWQNGATMPTTAVAGEEISLPKPAITDKFGSTVKTYTSVKAYFVPSGKTNDQSAWQELSVKDFKLMASKIAVDGDSYVVKYQINDFFGTTMERQYTLTNIKDSKAPTVYYVKGYEKHEEAFESKEQEKTYFEDIINTADEANLMLPKYATTGVNIVLPAIFADDNSRNIDSEDLNKKNISFTRTYTLKNVTKTIDTPANEEYTFTPEKAGVYTFYYTATDANGNSSSKKSFTINVEEGYAGDNVIEITNPTTPSIAYVGDKVTFDAPTAVAYAKDTKILADDKVKVEVSYYYGDDAQSATPLTLNEDGKYELDVEQNQNITLVYTATDHAKYSVKEQNNVLTNKVVISVKDVSGDTDAPTLITDLTSLDEKYTSIGQQSTNKKTAGVVFEDDNAVNIKIRVTSPSLNGSEYDYSDITNSVSVSGKTVTKENNRYSVSEATFVCVTSGDQVVTYIATDENGNTSIEAYKLNIKKENKPSIDLPRGASNNIKAEVGKEINLPTPVVMYDGKDVTSEAQNITITASNNSPGHSLIGYKFVAKEHNATYTFTYEATFNGIKADPLVITISATDTIKPEIKLDDEWDWEEGVTEIVKYIEEKYVEVDGNYVKYDENKHSKWDKTGTLISVPGFSVSDENNEINESSIKITAPGGEVTEKTFNNMDEIPSEFQFLAKTMGTATIEYSCTDKAGNSTTKQYTMRIGEDEKPTLEFKDGYQDIESKAKLGSKLTIDLTKINATDNVDKEVDGNKAFDNQTNAGLKLVVKVTSPSGSTTTLTKKESKDTTLTVDLTEAGDYTINYILTDTAGNVRDDYKYTITVASKSSSSIIGEAVWGTILVIASVTLLAGVVVYFIATNKKYSSKKRED